MSADVAVEPNKVIRISGKIVIGLLLILLVIFAVVRSVDMAGSPANAAPFEARYFEHPVIASMHMLFSMVFVLLAPLQFSTRIRSRHRKLHRWLGRCLVVCATLSGIYGIAALVYLPVFGGLPSQTASWFFGPLFLWCVYAGYTNARNRRFAQHREWMIRLYALGLGVGTQRFLVVLLQIAGHDFYSAFGPALWLGFSINLLIAEYWITKTKAKTRT